MSNFQMALTWMRNASLPTNRSQALPTNRSQAKKKMSTNIMGSIGYLIAQVTVLPSFFLLTY